MAPHPPPAPPTSDADAAPVDGGAGAPRPPALGDGWWSVGRRRWLRAGAGLAYAAALALVVASNGFPLERVQVLLWLMGALLIATAGRPGGGALRILRDWVPLGLALAAYDLSRGMADSLGMPVQLASLARLERGLFGWAMGGDVPTVWAQARLGPYVGPARWWEVPVALVYLSHFVVAFALLGWLWARDRPAFGAFRDRFLGLTAAGLATYVLLPAAPPWMASEAGLIGRARRVGLRGLEPLGLHTADSLVRYGARFGNPVAALPSLHAGWSALVALFLCTRVRRRWWPLLLAYPLWMGVALVISGEHYVADVLLGYLYAGAVMVGWAAWDRSRARRRVGGDAPVAAGR